MPIRRKSHTLTFTPITETPDATTKIVPVPTEGTSFDLRGQLTPMSAEQSYRATGLELTNGYLFMADASANAKTLTVNYKAVDADSNVYQVRTRPKVWEAIASLSCVEIYLELLEVTP